MVNMGTAEGTRLSQVIRQKMEEIKRLCGEVDETTASRSPSGRWSPKQILSHLCGPEGVGFFPTIQIILDKETPRLDIEAENPFFTEKRSRMTIKELLSEIAKEYGHIAQVVGELSQEQLNRKAHIPLLKETPIGESPTLAMWVQAIGDYHLGWHIDHMKEILKALGVAIPPSTQ
jgi:hypothetical protein